MKKCGKVVGNLLLIGDYLIINVDNFSDYVDKWFTNRKPFPKSQVIHKNC